ncbi:MAG: V-type ATPase 116kDa subunit family protein [Gaiellaceae bacterium]
MPSADLALPARMSRVAVVGARARTREVLVELARAGCVELVGSLPAAEGEEVEAVRRLRRADVLPDTQPALLPSAPDVAALERAGRRDLLAGEVELGRRARLAVAHGSFAAWVGWAPTAALPQLEERLGTVGAAVVELARPAWVEPPTLVHPVPLERPFRPLVQVYGTARYRDIDPTLFTAVSFVAMFGMMFGDVGHGFVLALLGLWLRARKRGRFASFRALWAIPFAAGLAAVCFGLLYGEAFGPTGLVPRLWLDPLDRPVPLLLVALAAGAGLLVVSYLFGIVNRWRESGLEVALLDQSGVAGLTLFVGAAIFAGGLYWHLLAVEIIGGALAGVGLALLGLGLMLQAGVGAAAATQAGIELVDAVIRLGSNLISFSRLAAFGLMHAALGAVVFDAARALWGGVIGGVAAAFVFVLGNLVAFSLELLVTGVQALRLEYYELFSRVFSGEGHAFAPWNLPVRSLEEES